MDESTRTPRLTACTTEGLIEIRRKIRHMWRESANLPDEGDWPNEKIYRLATAELRRRGVIA